MKRLHANVGSRNTALEKRPGILKAVCVNATVNVLDGMIYDLMLVLIFQSVVRWQCIGVKNCSSSHMLVDFRLQLSLTAIRNNRSANFSATFQDSHDCCLVLCARSSDPAFAFAQVHVTSLAADERFVHFDFAAELGTEELILHSKADALKHEPCRLLRDLHITCDLVAAHAVLAVSKHPRCRKPLIKRNRRIFIDRSDFDRELALGMMTTAFPGSALGVETSFRRSTAGTDYAVRPAPDSNIVDAIVGIGEVHNRFLKAARFAFHD